MKTSRLLATVVGALAVASLAASCGDNSAVCGDGTVEVDGVCVPDEEVECGAGTVNMGGQCVPDGSVICEQGTVFDEESGTCVVDPSACAAGTVLVDGVCVPEDETLTADEEEVAEPNDGVLASDDVAGQFALPAVGASTTIHGCINPYRDLDDNGNLDPDLDLWIVTTAGPALVDITADGVGGLAAGYQVISATDVAVVDDNFVRFGINLTGDTSSRQMYLPAGGVYGIFMADSRSLFLQDGAAGSPEACYYATISNLALPAATAVTVNTDVVGDHDGDVDFYSADPADCNFFIGVHDMQAAAAASSFWAIKNTVAYEYGEPDGLGTPGVVRTGGLFDADNVLYVIDPIYNYALNPVDYTLRVIAPPSGPIPTGGGDITITNIDDGEDFVGCYDIPADTMHNFEINATDPMDLIFIDGHGNLVTFQGTDFQDWIHHPAAGRYSVVIDTLDLAADVPSITLDSEIVTTPVNVLTPGTLVDNAPFNDVGNTWYSFDPGDNTWLGFSVPETTNWGSELSLDFYDLDSVGVPDNDFGGLFFMDIESDGSETVGRIAQGDTNVYLVKVTDFSGTADSTSTYDLDIAPRDFEDLGAVTEAAPIDSPGHDLATESGLFFVTASRGSSVTITITPVDPDQFDVVLDVLGPTETVIDSADSGGSGSAEVLTAVLQTTDFLAFRVTNFDADGIGTFDVDITIDNPMYITNSSNLLYIDACTSGSVIPLTPTGTFPSHDEGVSAPQTPPAGFQYFGSDVTSFQASSNGFLSFETLTGNSFTHSAVGSASAPNGFIAPLWVDLENTQVCIAGAGTNTMVIQWEGHEYFDATQPVQMQVWLSNTGNISLVYGAGHVMNGDPGTVGLENLTGQTPHADFGFDTAGATIPGASWVSVPE